MGDAPDTRIPVTGSLRLVELLPRDLAPGKPFAQDQVRRGLRRTPGRRLCNTRGSRDEPYDQEHPDHQQEAPHHPEPAAPASPVAVHHGSVFFSTLMITPTIPTPARVAGSIAARPAARPGRGVGLPVEGGRSRVVSAITVMMASTAAAPREQPSRGGMGSRWLPRTPATPDHAPGVRSGSGHSRSRRPSTAWLRRGRCLR